jgi:hypothetical protein
MDETVNKYVKKLGIILEKKGDMNKKVLKILENKEKKNEELYNIERKPFLENLLRGLSELN